jgi:hypothetical protein
VTVFVRPPDRSLRPLCARRLTARFVACALLGLQDEAREEILRNNGSLSHHHGIGKLRKKWVPQMVSPLGVDTLRALKASLDPQNIFAAGNIV